MPSPAAAPAATQLRISGNSTGPILTGQTVTLSAVATLSNGSTQIVSASWSSGPAAAVDANGVVTGLSNGVAAVNATFKGLAAQVNVQVIQSYVGTWAGDYVVTNCAAAGDFQAGGYCRSSFTVGSSEPVMFSLTQNLTTVSGLVDLGAVAGTLNGVVHADGHFVATGVAADLIDNATFVAMIGGFDSTVSGTALSAHWSASTTATGFSGNGFIQVQTGVVVRTSRVPGALPLAKRASPLAVAWNRAGSRTLGPW